jgi:hypothetical protein
MYGMHLSSISPGLDVYGWDRLCIQPRRLEASRVPTPRTGEQLDKPPIKSLETLENSF